MRVALIRTAWGSVAGWGGTGTVRSALPQPPDNRLGRGSGAGFGHRARPVSEGVRATAALAQSGVGRGALGSKIQDSHSASGQAPKMLVGRPHPATDPRRLRVHTDALGVTGTPSVVPPAPSRHGGPPVLGEPGAPGPDECGAGSGAPGALRGAPASREARLGLHPISQNALGYMRDALLILLAKTWGAKVVTHLHGGYFRHFYEEAGRPVRHLIRLTTHRIDSAWVLGEGLRSIYEGLLPPERVRVVPNGVPDVLEGDRRLAAGAAEVAGVPGPASDTEGGPRESAADVGDRVVTILYLGSLLRSKGVFEILEAASLLDERGIRARFVLAGEWVHTEDRLAAHTFLRERRLDGGVSFPGVVQGALKAELLEDADIFAFPTYYPLEGQPLVIWRPWPRAFRW